MVYIKKLKIFSSPGEKYGYMCVCMYVVPFSYIFFLSCERGLMVALLDVCVYVCMCVCICM